jgi:hypothetical protein
MSDDKYVVLHVEGGLGKNVAATAIVKPLAEKHSDRKLVLIVSWPEIFLNNPYAHRVYNINAPAYFYDDFIKDKDTIVYRREPYFESTHIMQDKPLLETWFSMYGLNFNPNVNKPEIHLNMYTKQLHNNWLRQKPIFLIQTNGGPFPENMQNNIYSWTRDIPFSLANYIGQEALRGGYHVMQICRANSPQIQGAEVINQQMNNLELFSILKAAKKRLLIDSCLQHAAAAFDLSSTVLWVGTKPTMFGYSIHNNIIANEPKNSKVHLMGSTYFDYNLSGEIHECPYNDESEIFNPNYVLNSLNL